MSGIMHTVDQRTNLAGSNRMELLLFRMNGSQVFGINVFKVREVIVSPPLVKMPKSHTIVRGVAHIRGKTISIFDLSQATTGRALAESAGNAVIITEYNRSVQGFLVAGVDRIVNVNWQDVLPPPQNAAGAYLTAVAKVDGKMVQIVDVEKVLDEVNRAGGVQLELQDSTGLSQHEGAGQYHILVADDSVVARNQIKRTLEKIGVEYTLVNDGQSAYETLQAWEKDSSSPFKRLAMVISDIEMPRMDGYSLTTAIRGEEGLKHIHVLLHTSLSGMFNKSMVQRVGANDFLPKFHPDELAGLVVARLDALAP
ncbi:chemotaxis protein CheW [Alkalilimnicola ehrlichii]|uniref:Chemotaxis protein CheW n=2 Tax=Alkalilimnicola ehrlichii TaxID=351052 RepID=A0A3E0WTL0_9GAMM|nr:chemotaxis protein [Alkalilimnicola ehrlichii]RFA28565.1 chemotaxis protein CheW [Alkalilimnicola ehrlichii]RFA35729.1 chemotaxis protein CheW [Alkalilimnicola ehrlichii]